MESNLDLSSLSLNKNQTETAIKTKNINNDIVLQEKLLENDDKIITNKPSLLLNQLKGALLVITAVFLFSLAAIFLKLSSTLNFGDHLFNRSMLQLSVFSIICKIKKVKIFSKQQYKSLLLLGMCYAIMLSTTFIALSFIDPSDVITIVNTSLIVTTLLSRVFLNERLTIVHLIAFFLTITGVLFIARPTFIFGNKLSSINNMTISQTIEVANQNEFKKYFGIGLALTGALCMGITNVLIKKLLTVKVHFAVVNLYPAYFTLPISVAISLIMFLFGFSHKNLKIEIKHYPLDIFYSLAAATCGVIGIGLFNMSYKYEEATKIVLIKTIDVFFSFLLQYIILGIKFDLFAVIGALLIIGSIIVLMIIKIFEFKISKLNCFCSFLVKKF